jgi:hypothetical protein
MKTLIALYSTYEVRRMVMVKTAIVVLSFDSSAKLYRSFRDAAKSTLRC